LLHAWTRGIDRHGRLRTRARFGHRNIDVRDAGQHRNRQPRSPGHGAERHDLPPSPANFTINTTPPTTLSSDASLPDATALSTTLTEGSYLVTLQPGWLLDKWDPTFGTGTPVVATLVSANPAVAFVQAGNTKTVTFQFESSGAVITTGTLAIGIGVTEVDGGTP
jgi:hypothetical protein